MTVEIKDRETNIMASSGLFMLDNIFPDAAAVATFYVSTGIYNPIILFGFKHFQLSFLCFKQRENIFLVNEELIAKRVMRNMKTTFRGPSDELMREILPFFEIQEHDCIIKLVGFAHFEDSLFLILERFGESLDEHIKKRDLDSEKILKIILCVCCGLIHMHQHNYIHRDIKPGNIVVNKSGEAKLIACSYHFGISRPYLDDDLTEEVGMSRYMAPEVNGI